MHGSVHLKAGARSTLQVYIEQSSMSTGSYPICPPMMYIYLLCLTPCLVNPFRLLNFFVVTAML